MARIEGFLGRFLRRSAAPATATTPPPDPAVTPELIGILAVGATVIGLLLTFRRDARADNQALRAEFRADNQRLREEVHAGMESSPSCKFHADIQSFRERKSALTLHKSAANWPTSARTCRR